MNESQSVLIELLGKEYRVACPAGERENLLRAAHLLDEKLIKVREAGINSTERIAMMTALNFAHELLKNKEQPLPSDKSMDTLLKKVNAELTLGEKTNTLTE